MRLQPERVWRSPAVAITVRWCSSVAGVRAPGMHVSSQVCTCQVCGGTAVPCPHPLPRAAGAVRVRLWVYQHMRAHRVSQCDMV